MPFQIEDVDKHKKGLTDKEKTQWVAIANSVYDKCLKDGGEDASCAVDAIKEANGATKERSIEDNDFELRTFQNEELRVNADSRNVFGTAIVFNRESQLIYEGGQLFYEKIAPEAMTGVIDKSDIKVYLNHDKGRGLLARSNKNSGSLSLNADNTALKFSFDAPKFGLGDELIENIKRGDIKGNSFAFRVAEGGENWSKRSDGHKLRTITQFQEA